MASQREEIAPVKSYLEGLMRTFQRPLITYDEGVGAEKVPERVFEVLTDREFCYLSKSRVSAYRESVLAAASWAVRQGDPIRFYYDLGGGYHASTNPGEEELSFDVGLAELFVLRQIASFSTRVRRFYAPGVRVSLVIDNMCALLINDIPLVKTLGYCARLRTLNHELGLDDVLDVLVESEHLSLADFGRAQAAALGRNGSMTVTSKQHDNVERFLGRRCDGIEAYGRTVRYHEAIDASERLLAPFIRGVHMTQRASDRTICFRPFPGGDSRIQCGQVVLTASTRRKLYPVLLTSSNRGRYACRCYRFPEILPSLIPHVTYADPLEVAGRIPVPD